jgi:hypothetical protein
LNVASRARSFSKRGAERSGGRPKWLGRSQKKCYNFGLATGRPCPSSCGSAEELPLVMVVGRSSLSFTTYWRRCSLLFTVILNRLPRRHRHDPTQTRPLAFLAESPP